jgi:hypothetical protein
MKLTKRQIEVLTRLVAIYPERRSWRELNAPEFMMQRLERAGMVIETGRSGPYTIYSSTVSGRAFLQKLEKVPSEGVASRKNLTKIIREAIELSQLSVNPTIPDPVISAAVEQLCVNHGYGNVMATAQALWQARDPRGAHTTNTARFVHEQFIAAARPLLTALEKNKA